MKKEFTMSIYSNKENLNADKEEFLSRCSVVVHDNDGYSYIIPHSKIGELEDYLKSDSCKEGSELPHYAEIIDGMSVAFENYTLLL